MNFKEELYTFPSGLKLVMLSAPNYYTSEVKIIFKVGAEDEPKEYGISHLIEHCVFKGTSTLKQEDISVKLDSLAADVDASTSSEFTTYKAIFPRPNIEPVLDLLSKMLFDSTFDKDEVEKEKKVILEEIKMHKDQPEQQAFDNLIKKMYKGYGIGNDIAGSEQLLKQVLPSDMREYQQKYYNAQNAVISVVGDYKKQEIVKIVDKYLNQNLLKNGNGQKNWSLKPTSHGEMVTEIKAINQANIMLGYRALPYENMDRIKFGIIAYILGGSMSSRLFTKIRNELSLCYSVYSFSISYKNSGFLGISLATSPENASLAIKEVKNELHKLLINGVTEEEWQAAKSMRYNKFLMEQDRPRTTLSYVAYTGELLNNKKIEEIINSVTREEAMEIFRNTINEEDVFISYVGKKNKNNK